MNGYTKQKTERKENTNAARGTLVVPRTCVAQRTLSTPPPPCRIDKARCATLGMIRRRAGGGGGGNVIEQLRYPVRMTARGGLADQQLRALEQTVVKMAASDLDPDLSMHRARSRAHKECEWKHGHDSCSTLPRATTEATVRPPRRPLTSDGLLMEGLQPPGRLDCAADRRG
jgi:hypothetical protein